MHCHFAALDELASQARLPPAPPSSVRPPLLPNAHCTILKKGLAVKGVGGTQFPIPLEHKVSRVLPLVEGLLIEYELQKQPKYSDLQAACSRREGLLEEKERLLSYVTLSQHPYNSLKVLGSLKKDSPGSAWFRSGEHILFASQHIPVVVSYNPLLRRHCFHFLRTSKPHRVREDSRLSIYSDVFLLGELGDSELSLTNSYLLTEQFFEEPTSAAPARDCVFTRANHFSEFSVNLLVGQEVLIYRVRPYCSTDLGITSLHSVVLEGTIPRVLRLDTCSLLDSRCPRLFDYERRLYKDHQDKFEMARTLSRLVEASLNSELVVHGENITAVYHGSRRILQSSVPLTHPKLRLAPEINDSVVKMVLLCLRQVLEPGIFYSLLSDFINGCIDTLPYCKRINPSLLSEYEGLCWYLASLGCEPRQGKAQPKVCSIFNIQEQHLTQRKQFNQFTKLVLSAHHVHKRSPFQKHLRPQSIAPEVIRTRGTKQLSEARPEFRVPVSLTTEELRLARPRILTILHLLRQELRLDRYSSLQGEKVSFLVYILAKAYSCPEYEDFYLRDLPSNFAYFQTNLRLREVFAQLEKGRPKLSLEPPTDILTWLQNLMDRSRLRREVGAQSELQRWPIAFKTSKFVCKFFEILLFEQPGVRFSVCDLLVRQKSLIPKNPRQAAKNASYPLLGADPEPKPGSKLKQLEPKVTSITILLFLYLIRKGMSLERIGSFPPGIAVCIFEVLRGLRCRLPGWLYEQLPRLGFKLIKREDMYENWKLYNHAVKEATNALDETVGMVTQVSQNKGQVPGQGVRELFRQQHEQVIEEALKLLSTQDDMVIRGRDLESIPEDRWQVESHAILSKFMNRRLGVLVGQGALNLGSIQQTATQVVRIPKINMCGLMPNEVRVTLEAREEKDVAMLSWPEFHSGVATGLRLARRVFPPSPEHLRTWIFYQKPAAPRMDHSGLIYSLGLQGLLDCFSPTDIYQYLKMSHEASSVAILLGISASRIGKSDESTNKTLGIHIPFLLPPSYDIEIPVNVQSAALVGAGLLHAGTANRVVTETALNQIGRKPSNDKCNDREGLSLSAGICLGLVNLAGGSKRVNLKDLELQTRLIRFIEGGKVLPPPHSVLSSSFIGQSKSSSIREGDMVNTHVTAPAALLALSLMYMRSENEELAQKISLPCSFAGIEDCNPGHVLLKVTAKCLIRFGSIGKDLDWLRSNIPDLIRFLYEHNIAEVAERYYLVYNVDEVDFATVTAVYWNSLAGAALAMALKYAGTADGSVLAALIKLFDQLRKVKTSKSDNTIDSQDKNSIEQYLHFTLLCSVMLSVSLVMSGTCDPRCLQMAKSLRKRLQDCRLFHYGFNLAVHMAVGNLCLGMGKHLFGNCNRSIAALLVSVFPTFPSTPSDNTYHLQALRHFYVLAIKEKTFHAVNFENGQALPLTLECRFRHAESKEVVSQTVNSPFLLQDSKQLLSVKLSNPSFYQLDFNFSTTGQPPRVIYVKRKTTAAQGLPHDIRFLQALIEDKAVADRTQRALGSSSLKQLAEWLVKEDRTQMLEVYLPVLMGGPMGKQCSQSLRLLRKFISTQEILFDHDYKFYSATKLQIMQNEIEQPLHSRLQRLLESGVFQMYELGQLQTREQDLQLVALLKTLHIPTLGQLEQVLQFFKKVGQSSDGKSLRRVLKMYMFNSFTRCDQKVLDLLVEFYLTHSPK